MTNTAKKVSAKIKENLKFHRKNASLTQIQLGILAGLSQDYISHIEQEKNFPSVKALCKIADVLNIEPYELLK